MKKFKKSEKISLTYACFPDIFPYSNLNIDGIPFHRVILTEPGVLNNAKLLLL